MPTCNLAAGDPLSLSLAADARLPGTNYADDQVWELRLNGGEPPALALETTYGLRAQRVRIFPRFFMREDSRSDPDNFHSPPRVVQVYPNYLAVLFYPFEELEVLAEYRILNSQTVAGRMRMSNRSILPVNFRLEMAVLLAPGGMAPVSLVGGAALAGQIERLQPVFTMGGVTQAAAGPFPALALDFSLYPGNLRLVTWAMAGLPEEEASLEAAQQAIRSSWDAETARIELMEQSQTVQVQTGNPDWDAALAMAQKNALGLFLCNQANLPEASFVLSRRPDQGYSARGDGADHRLPWAGQTALDAYHLASLLPGAPEMAAGLLRNFLAIQDEEGRIDWRPGLAGQRTRRLAQPLLSSLAMHILPGAGDEERQALWAAAIYPGLLRFFKNWFRLEHDSDDDDIPEWENALQIGLDDIPVFNRFAPEPKGTDASRVESPSLTAMLYHECTSLIQLARLAGPEAEPDLPELERILTRLQTGLDEAWDSAAGTYRYRDYASHLSTAGMSMLSFQGPGEFSTKRRFKQPRRLVIRLEAYEERTYAATLTITGYTPEGEVTETVGPRSFAWLSGQAHAVTQHTYLAIEQVEVLGVGPRDRGRLFAPDLTQEDCSLLLPLWAGACSSKQASQMVETVLLPRYRRSYGIALSPEAPASETPDSSAGSHVSILWNQLLGEGLLRYGYRAEAGALVASLLDVSAAALKQQHAFHQHYHADTGQPSGERAHLHGFAPLGLFLKTLGIQQLGADEILLDGFSPFTTTITVQYRRTKIICHHDRTEVSFAGGAPVTVDQPGTHRLVR